MSHNFFETEDNEFFLQIFYPLYKNNKLLGYIEAIEYIEWLRKKVAVYGYVFDGRWYDIGHPNFYKEAKGAFKS